MNVLQSAKSVLERAETSLRDLAAKAAAEGDYDGVVRLIDWAKGVQGLMRSTTLPELGGTNKSADPMHLHVGRAEKLVAVESPKAARPASASSRRKVYPVFVRDGDSLVKIAWSKSSKDEYEHKAPGRVLSILVATLDRLASRRRLISMDQVLPLKEGDGSEVPAYQAYICLGFLKQNGLVLQHGRQGYSLKAGIKLSEAAASIWEHLAERQRN